MDNFTFGMFGELADYEERAEYEAWLDSMPDSDDDGEFPEDMSGEEDFA
jgi:hypothetical protein